MSRYSIVSMYILNYLPWEWLGLTKWIWRQEVEKKKEMKVGFGTGTEGSINIEYIKQLTKFHIKFHSSQIRIGLDKFVFGTWSIRLVDIESELLTICTSVTHMIRISNSTYCTTNPGDVGHLIEVITLWKWWSVFKH